MRILKCRLTTIETLLGTASNNKELHSEFIASKAPDAPSREEEIEAVGVEEVIEKGMTVFSRNKDGKPILWDYQIKGFFKDACGVLRKVKGTCEQRGDCGGSCAGVFRACDGGRIGAGGEGVAKLREAAGAWAMAQQRQGQIPL